jgi:hypothetical protein
LGRPETACSGLAFGQPLTHTFGGAPSVIGRTIEVYGGPRVIIGALPEGFRYLDMPGAGMTNNPSVVVPWMLDSQKIYLGFLTLFRPVSRPK